MSQRIASLHAEIGADVSGLERGLDRAKGGLSDFSGSLLKIGGGLIALGATMKTVFDFAKEQAQVDFMRQKFDTLAISVGTTADVLMEDLRKATSGLVSDMTLAASATGFMELGLVKTREEAVRLTAVAGQLGMDMNQLTLTLTNQTTMRFDALGVSVDGFKERVDELKAAGMSANDAFKEAFLQQAEEQIEKVGSVADSTAASFLEFEANMKNLVETGKSELLPFLSDAVTAANLLTFGSKKIQEAYRNQEREAYNTAASYEDYIRSVLSANVANGLVEQSQLEQIVAMANAGVEISSLVGGVAHLTRAEYDVSQATEFHNWALEQNKVAIEAVDSALLNISPEMDKFAGAQTSAAAAAENDKRAQEELAAALAAQDQDVRNAAQGYWSLAESLKGASQAQVAKAAMDQLGESLQSQKLSVSEYDAAMRELGLAFGIFTPQSIALQDGINALNQAYEAGVLPVNSYDEAMAALRQDSADGVVDFDALIKKFGEMPSATELAKTGMNTFALDGLGPVSEGLEAIGGEEGAAYGTEVAMKTMATNIAGEEVTGKMNTFAKDVLEGSVSRGFKAVVKEAGKAESAIIAVATRMKELDGMSATVHINTVERGGGGYSGKGVDVKTGEYHPMASGGDFIVPPGYPRDSFPINVQSGEHVQVTPAGKSGGGSDSAILAALQALPGQIARSTRDAVLMGMSQAV